MKVWPVLTLGSDRELVHTEGAAKVETFIRNTPDAELLAVHTYTFDQDEYTNAEYIYLGIVQIPGDMPSRRRCSRERH